MTGLQSYIDPAIAGHPDDCRCVERPSASLLAVKSGLFMIVSRTWSVVMFVFFAERFSVDVADGNSLFDKEALYAVDTTLGEFRLYSFSNRDGRRDHRGSDEPSGLLSRYS